MRRYTVNVLTTGFAILLSTAAAAQDPDTECEVYEGKIPKFIMEALTSPHAMKAKLYITKDGSIDRSKVVLQREGMPEWTHPIAEDKLGTGEDVSYEAEVYADGTAVYEICRMVDGKPKKVSIRRDKSVRYIEMTIERDAVPEEVAATVAKLQGFKADEWRRREGENLSEVHVRGSVAGIPHRARLKSDGTLLSVDKHLAAEVEVSITSRPEPAVK
jgi:hypothetical protein